MADEYQKAMALGTCPLCPLGREESKDQPLGGARARRPLRRARPLCHAWLLWVALGWRGTRGEEA